MMKKIILTLILAFIFLFISSYINVDAATGANGETAPSTSHSSTYSSSYYDSVVGKKGDALLEGLASLTRTNHKTYTTYEQLKGGLSSSDAAGSGKVYDFYMQTQIDNSWTQSGTNYSKLHWNREHVWCQSLTNGLYGEDGAGSDIHHVRPEIISINSSRNNALYGELSNRSSYAKYFNTTDGVDATSSSGTLYGYLDSTIDSSTATTKKEGVFEPKDSVKGDVARILMYVYMHYSTEVSANSGKTYCGSLKITDIVYKTTNQAAWNMLLEWNTSDPVDSKETARHKYAVSATGTRNPFIDHPEFANMIWNTSYSGGGAMNDNGSSSGDSTGDSTGGTVVTPSVDYSALLTEYHNGGIYTKKSNIYLNSSSTAELAKYFHGDVAKDRTTYYNGEYLLMGDIDGTFNTINSGYRTSGSDVKHFTYQNGNVVDDYTVKDTTLHKMYVTMNKFKTSNYLDSSWVNGEHTVTGISDTYLSDFLAFTAPCLTDYVLSSNYLIAKGMKLTISESTNKFGSYLALRIYTTNTDSGKVVSNSLLSEARIYKGNTLFDEGSNVEPSPINTTIAKLVSAPPTTEKDAIYVVTGTFTLGSGTYDATYGNGTLTDDNGNTIEFYGLSSSKSCLSFADGLYTYTNSKDFSSLGITDGSVIKVGMVYTPYYKNYSAYLIEVISYGETTPETPSTPSEPVVPETPTLKDATYSYTFTSSVYKAKGTIALGDRNWRLSGNVEDSNDEIYYSYNSTKGHQFGSETNPFYTLNLTVTTDFTQISSIYITTCGATNTQAKLNIYVGDVSYGERTLTSTSTTYRVTPGGVTGRVSFKYSQSTKAGVAKAIYIKEIKVYYKTGASATYTADDLMGLRNEVKDIAYKGRFVNNYVALIEDKMLVKNDKKFLNFK